MSALMLVLPFLAIILAWKVYSIQLQSNELTSRSLIFHPMSKTHWHEFYLSIKSLLFNNAVSFISLIVLVLFTFAIIVRNFTKRKLTSISNYQFLVLSAFSYLVFIIFAISFFDFAIPLDTRILAPFSILTIIALVSIIYKCLKQYNTVLIPAFMLLSLIYVAGNIKKSYIFWEKYRLEGDGFNSSKYDALEINEIEHLTDGKTIYSNQSAFLKYKFPNKCDIIQPVPKYYIEINDDINSSYENEIKELLNLIKNKKAALFIYLTKTQIYQKENEKIIEDISKHSDISINRYNNLIVFE
jgi:prepilin signal peptidase PulO-like enzyme (type II secretory pathway)